MKDTNPNAQGAGPDALAARPEKTQPFVRALADESRARFHTLLGRPVTPDTLLGSVDAYHAFYEQTWDYVKRLHVVPHACRSGCDACCHLTIETTAPEVFRITAFLRDAWPRERLADFRKHLREIRSGVQGLSPQERAAAKVPCALLVEGRCAAYAVRPLACRSWNSRDAGACLRVLEEGGGDLRPVQDQRPLGINAGVNAGYVAALRAAGLPEDPERQCELNTALDIALGDPGALAGWLGGTDTLAAARAVVRYGPAPGR